MCLASAQWSNHYYIPKYISLLLNHQTQAVKQPLVLITAANEGLIRVHTATLLSA